MKKTLSLFLCLVIVGLFSVSVIADGFSLKLTPNAKIIAQGETVSIKVGLSGDIKGTSSSLSVTVSDGLTVKSGEITRSDATIKAFDMSNNKGVAAYGNEEVSLAGDYAVVNVTAKNGMTGVQRVEIEVMVNPSGMSAKAVVEFNAEDKPDNRPEQNSSITSGEKENNPSGEISSKTEGNGSEKTDNGAPESKTEKQPHANKNINANALIMIVSFVILAAVIAVVIGIWFGKKKDK